MTARRHKLVTYSISSYLSCNSLNSFLCNSKTFCSYSYNITKCKAAFSTPGALLENNNLGYSPLPGASRGVFGPIAYGKGISIYLSIYLSIFLSRTINRDFWTTTEMRSLQDRPTIIRLSNKAKFFFP